MRRYFECEATRECMPRMTMSDLYGDLLGPFGVKEQNDPILNILENPRRVHRAARPLRDSVSCGSGWSVPCVSIQLTLSQLQDSRYS